MADADTSQPNDLIEGFRLRFHAFRTKIEEAVANSSDTVLLRRLGDDLQEYANLVNEHETIFSPEEYSLIRLNLAIMQNDVHQQYQQVVDESHHGHPTIVRVVQTGTRGRPQIQIDPDWLRWAYTMRTTSSIAIFLGVSRTVVRNHLLALGIAEAQEQPFVLSAAYTDALASAGGETDELLDPPLNEVFPGEQPQDISPPPTLAPHVTDVVVTSYTGPLSSISDEELDDLLLRLRGHFRRAGITILDGMLRRLGHRIPRQRIRESLTRIDPVRRVFERITIRRRVYNVPGPNSLWHHDGQHGLIRWGIVIHGFIDGYSRLITALQAHNNNRAQTVLDLFIRGCRLYGVPSRLRGDHGLENLFVAAWMEAHMGQGRGSYLWGRSVHNVRIERLWVDITAQVGATWAELFTILELQHGLNINNPNHIWLLHFLFLPTINSQLDFFVQSWNHHRIQICNGPNRSPADMFGFDMYVHGVRGCRLPPGSDIPDQLPPEDNIPDEELEVLGVDWEGFREEHLLQSLEANNPRDEPGGSWIRHPGPPERLNEVRVEEPPTGIFTQEELNYLDQLLQPLAGLASNSDVAELWTQGLALATVFCPELF